MTNEHKAYFINTDAKSLGGESPHNLWFEHKQAFVGGHVHGRELTKLNSGDLLLMWVNKKGVAGIGRVLSKGDGIVHEMDALIYVGKYGAPEYRLPVDWFLDLRRRPMNTEEIKARKIRGSNPSSSFAHILNIDAVHETVTDLLLHLPDSEKYPPIYPDEVVAEKQFTEGKPLRVQVDARERNPAARSACLAAKGYSCTVCGFNFSDKYGSAANGIIHVHHLDPLSESNGPREVDPIADLIPVCPNCHAVIHSRRPTPYTPEEVKQMLGI